MNIHAQSASAPPARWSDPPPIGCGDLFSAVHHARECERRRPEHTAFEIHNGGGKLIRGVEIELAGFGDDDVFRAYYVNRYGTLAVIRNDDSIRVRFESIWRTPVRTLSQTILVQEGIAGQPSRPFIWQFALHGGGSSERTCLETSTRNVIASYWWLVEADASGDRLVAESTPACVKDARNRAAWTAGARQ